MDNIKNGTARKADPAKSKLWKYFTEYSEMTGIQGIRYVTEKRSRVELIFWIIILLTSLAGCIFMIFEILDKYNNTPIIVNFSTHDTPIYKIPFPAVTVCFEAKFSRQKVNYKALVNKVFYTREKLNLTESEKYLHMSVLCEDSNVLTEGKANEDFYDTIEKVKLEDKFGECWFDEEPKKCKDIFIPTVLDNGLCYSFNTFGRHEVFNKDVWWHYSNYYRVQNNSRDFFDVETGYKKNVNTSTYPRRVFASGQDYGLIVHFKTNPKDATPTCNVMEGIRVLVHNPWDVPRLSKHRFYVPKNKIVSVAVEPEITETSDTIRNFSPEKRKCFMRNERSLMFFQEYSQPNCLFECTTNYTLSECGCARFFMPRHNNTPICAGVNDLCASRVKIKDLEFESNGDDLCDCRPSCANLKYNVVTGHNDLNSEYINTYYLRLSNSKQYDFSVLEVYFKDEQFTTKEMSQLYGTSDLISQLGGLLGLFTGFSFITAAEIIYFCSMRIYYNTRLHGDWSGASN